MVLTLDERLERIDQLRSRRDEQRELVATAQKELDSIERELEDVLAGATPKPLTVRDKQKEKPNNGKGRPTSDRKCGKCGGKGHTARTCEHLPDAPAVSSRKGIAMPDRPAKECCGSRGARHYNWCIAPKSSGPLPTMQGDAVAPAPAKKVPLSQEQYNDLQVYKHSPDFSSAEYSLSRKLSPTEVNTAIRSTDYDDYIAIR